MTSGTSAASDRDGDDGRDVGVRRLPNGSTGPARRLLRGRMNAGSDSQAIRWPSSPRNAGSKVMATSTAATTAIAEARPSALTSGMPATPSETRAMTTSTREHDGAARGRDGLGGGLDHRQAVAECSWWRVIRKRA